MVDANKALMIPDAALNHDGAGNQRPKELDGVCCCSVVWAMNKRLADTNDPAAGTPHTASLRASCRPSTSSEWQSVRILDN